MPTIQAHKLSLNQGRLVEQPLKTNSNIVKGNGALHAQEAIDALTNNITVYWDPRAAAGLQAIRAHFKQVTP